MRSIMPDWLDKKLARIKAPNPSLAAPKKAAILRIKTDSYRR
jgi:hypothetical protein